MKDPQVGFGDLQPRNSRGANIRTLQVERSEMFDLNQMTHGIIVDASSLQQ